MEKSDSNNKKYIIKLYNEGNIIDTQHTDNFEDAKKIYFLTSDILDLYTQLNVDGEDFTSKQAEDFLDPTGSYLYELRNKRLELLTELKLNNNVYYDYRRFK